MYPDFLTRYYEAARGPFRRIASIHPSSVYTLAELPELVRVYGLPQV